MDDVAVTPAVPADVERASIESDQALAQGKIALAVLRRREAIEAAGDSGRPRLLAVLHARLAEALRALGAVREGCFRSAGAAGPGCSAAT